MSASPAARNNIGSKSIPSRKVMINHESEMPLEYGTTPGGTMFGTTPGGTRIVYERNFLLQMRQSPLAQTPPTNLPKIPGVTAPREPNHHHHHHHRNNKKNQEKNNISSSLSSSQQPPKGIPGSIKEEDSQFDMEI